MNLTGDFQQSHREEILSLAHHVEQREKREHPLNRIMDILREDELVEITFTDANLARSVGEALHHAYHGELHYRYSQEDPTLRVTWHRED